MKAWYFFDSSFKFVGGIFGDILFEACWEFIVLEHLVYQVLVKDCPGEVFGFRFFLKVLSELISQDHASRASHARKRYCGAHFMRLFSCFKCLAVEVSLAAIKKIVRGHSSRIKHIVSPISMKTRLLYWENTYLLESSAQIVGIEEGSEEKPYLVFDSTIFYPQGGGQPSDLGEVWFEEQCLKVTFVQMVDGCVHHYVDGPIDLFQPGQTVRLLVDEKQRIAHARMHTAGHLLAIAASSVCPEWKPLKGYHFPDGCYVEFEGVLNEEKEAIIERLDSSLAAGIAQGWPIQAQVINEEGTRTVQIGEHPPVLYGGTHVASCSELGIVSVRKVKAKRGRVRVGYSVEG